MTTKHQDDEPLDLGPPIQQLSREESDKAAEAALAFRAYCREHDLPEPTDVLRAVIGAARMWMFYMDETDRLEANIAKAMLRAGDDEARH